MLNVLWLVSWYPNRLNKFDGDFIERHAIAVSRFAKLTILYVGKDESIPDNSVDVEKTTGHNLTIYRVYYGRSGFKGQPEPLLSLLKFRKLQKEFFKRIKAESGMPDLVHVHVVFKAGMLALWLKRKFKLPYVLTEHWTGYYPKSEPNIFNSNLIIRRITRAILKDAAMFLPVSNDLGKVINQYFTKVHYHPIPNVVDTDLFYYKPFKSPKFRFIHPSYLNYQKNPEGIFLACKKLLAEGYDFELVLVGDLDDELIQLAVKYGIDGKLILKGTILYKEVATEIQHSTALLLFSRFENLPCVILESLCSGLPVISSRVGGVPEVINKTNGILVESENVNELTEAMIAMIEHYNDYKRETIASTATKLFNYDIVGNQFLTVYKNVIASVQ